MRVRGYQGGDADRVNALARAAFAQYEGHYDDWPSFIDGIGQMAGLAAGGDLLVAEHEGELVGAVVHVGPGRARSPIFPEEWSVIRMLVVAPGHRGLGIGRQLVAACLACARRDAAPAVGLHTSPLMASALRLYTAIGFRRDADLPPIRGVPYGRYVLRAEQFDEAIVLLGGGVGWSPRLHA